MLVALERPALPPALPPAHQTCQGARLLHEACAEKKILHHPSFSSPISPPTFCPHARVKINGTLPQNTLKQSLKAALNSLYKGCAWQPGQILCTCLYCFSPCWLLAYFSVRSCSGSGTRLKWCSCCHGEMLEFAPLYLFYLFLNGSMMQYVKSVWLASTQDATNLELCSNITCLWKTSVKSWASFAADFISCLGLDSPGDSCLNCPLKQN